MRNTLLTPASFALLSVLVFSQACSSDETPPQLGDGSGGQSASTGGSAETGGKENAGGSGGKSAGGMGGETTGGGSGGKSTGGMGGEATGGYEPTGGNTSSGGSGGSEQTVENCTDGFDNDEDSYVDCSDSDCIAATACIFDCIPPAAYVAPTTTDNSIPAIGLALWLRADVGLATEANGKVCVWNDLSGGNRHLKQSESDARPWTNVSLGAQPAIAFSPTQLLARDDLLGIESTSGRTFFVVAQAQSQSERAFFLYQGKAGAYGNSIAIDINTLNTTGEKFGAYLTNNAYDSSQTTDLDAHIQSIMVDSMTVGGSISSNFHYYFDGLNINLTRTVGGLGDGSIEDFTEANITAVGGADIHVAEILIYDRPLNSIERGKVVSYLKLRYGI